MATDTASKSENFTLQNSEEEVICPSCDAKIKRSQVADHCQVEMERLRGTTAAAEINTAEVNTTTAATTATQTTQSGTGTSSGGETGTGTSSGQRRPWSVFQRVQRNRQARQRQRSRKRATPPPAAAAPAHAAPAVNNSSICPVCNLQFPQSQIQTHANACLRTNGQQNGHSSDEAESEEYEEYEWAGQKRIRVSTLVPGGYSSLNLAQTSKYHNGQQSNEDEDDVNVDEDDTHIYGPNQYGEADVIPLATEQGEGDGEGAEQQDVSNYVRSLISSTETVKNTPHSSDLTDDLQSLQPSTSRGHKSSTNTRSSHHNQQQIIESLKSRLRLLEQQSQQKLKCLICIDDYKNPAISVSCWHVHCEQCWLQTLGARKLCPQCNSITTPKDLRRIYL